MHHFKVQGDNFKIKQCEKPAPTFCCLLNCVLKPACWDRYDSTYMQARYGCTRHTWVYSKVNVLLPLACYSLTFSQNAAINEQGKICWHNYERQIYLSYYMAS